MFSTTKSPNYRIPIPSKGYFDNTHTMVLVSTFPRSGSTLLGYLLTAHRNIVIASEPAQSGENLYDGVPPMALLNHILYMDKIRFEEAKQQTPEILGKDLSSDNMPKRTYNKQDRYIFIPNQWQACCESLQVIGIKNSSQLARFLSVESTFDKFKKSIKKAGILHLKFIFTVRNPYDMLSTSVMYRLKNPNLPPLSENKKYQMLRKRLKFQFVTRCEIAEKIFELVGTQNIFINKHEGMVASTTDQLNKLCDFLKVPTFPDYLNDCATVVSKKPNKSRHELEWPQEQKEEMAKLIDKYHFFAGYSWDS